MLGPQLYLESPGYLLLILNDENRTITPHHGVTARQSKRAGKFSEKSSGIGHDQ